jgi:hypothetical protein
VTLRTPAALAALTAPASDQRLVVGAGTVVNARQVDAARRGWRSVSGVTRLQPGRRTSSRLAGRPDLPRGRQRD